MSDFFSGLLDYAPKITGKELVAVFSFVAICLAVSRVLVLLIARACRKRFGESGALLVQRLFWYPLLIIFVSNGLSKLGVDMSVLLGAAGVLTVAAGFAAQTSAANVISGLFLLGDHPFAIGDVIKFENVLGRVVAIDLLSVKVVTFDNLLVRIPNEVMLKKNVTNLSHFAIRRVDVPICIAGHEDLGRALDILRGVAQSLTCCLDEPEPIFVYKGFSRMGQEIEYCVWGTSDDYLLVRNTFKQSAKKALDDAGIALGIEQRVIETIESKTPLKVEIVPS